MRMNLFVAPIVGRWPRPQRPRPRSLGAKPRCCECLQSIGTLPWLTTDALKTLLDHSWPGNVRELENIVQRALVLCTEKEICSSDIVIDNNPLNIARNSLLEESKQQLAI